MSMYLGGDWSDTEIRKFRNREHKLILMGVPEMEAEKLAEQLVYRDRDATDDRRLCLECASWRKRCTTPAAGNCSVPTLLQRCDGFKSVRASMGSGCEVVG